MIEKMDIGGNSIPLNKENIETALLFIGKILNDFTRDLLKKLNPSFDYQNISLYICDTGCIAQYNSSRSITININEFYKYEKYGIENDIDINLVIAHEFGHHLSYLLDLKLSSIDEEIFADKFAGYALSTAFSEYTDEKDNIRGLYFFNRLGNLCTKHNLEQILPHGNGIERSNAFFIGFCIGEKSKNHIFGVKESIERLLK